VWKSRGTSIVDWYFAGYESIYLLWPWTMEVRFLLPIAPLAFFYTWQGIVGVVRSSMAKPRLVGSVWFPAAVLMTALSARSIHKHWALGKTDASDVLMIPVWLISAGCAVWMAYTGHSIFSLEMFSKARKWIKRPLGSGQPSPHHLLRYSSYLLAMSVMLIGVGLDIRIAR